MRLELRLGFGFLAVLGASLPTILAGTSFLANDSAVFLADDQGNLFFAGA